MKIIQIAACATYGKLRLFALREDGAIFYLDSGENQWKRIMPSTDHASPAVPEAGIA